MGGLSAAAAAGAAGSAGAAGAAGSAGAASSILGGASALGASKIASQASGGLSLKSLLGPIGTASDIKNIFDSKSSAKRQEKNATILQYLNMQRKKNILEQQLATRHARMSSMGISSSASADAANNRLIDEAFDDIERDNVAFMSQQEEYNNTQNQYRKNLLDKGLSIANKVLK